MFFLEAQLSAREMVVEQLTTCSAGNISAICDI
jgi:hypothetical protein